MNTNHEVISAFLDDEPFEPQMLADALADPAGRDLLIDAVLLRHVAQLEDVGAGPTSIPVGRPKRRLYFAAAAAVLVSLLGGYQLGQRHAADNSLRPPTATRVVDSQPVWQEVSGVR